MWTYMIVDGRLIGEYFEDEPPINSSVYILSRDGNHITFTGVKSHAVNRCTYLNGLSRANKEI